MDIRPSLKMTVAGRCFVSLPLGEGGSADCAETDEVFHAFLDLPHPPQAVPLPRGEGTDKRPFGYLRIYLFGYGVLSLMGNKVLEIIGSKCLMYLNCGNIVLFVIAKSNNCLVYTL